MFARCILAALLIDLSCGAAHADGSPAGRWPQFRGPQASGVAEGAALPATWDVSTGKGLRWKTRIPGLGHSSPVVWGDRVYVTTAVGPESDANLRVGLYGDIAPANDVGEQEWKVYCLDKSTGAIIWEQTAHRGVPKVKRHTKATHANSTPATDGAHVVAFFGSEGLYCYDAGGRLLWKKDFGVLDGAYYAVPAAQWGFGSSPVIHDGRVIVQCDVLKDSFLAVLDIKDGNEIWRVPRDDVPTWSTPAVCTTSDPPQVIVNGMRHIGGYDLGTGKEVWKMTGVADIPVPTPVLGHGLVFITNAHGAQPPIYAIRTTARGDITPAGDATSSEHLAWSNKRGVYMQTPLVLGERLFTCTDNGILTCYEAQTGKTIKRMRLGEGGEGFTASLVAGDGKIYATSEEGRIYVIDATSLDKPEPPNEMGEVCMSTPAISDGMLLIRGQKHLFAIGTP